MLEKLWLFFATLVYVFIEFLILEAISFGLFKTYENQKTSTIKIGSRKGKFRKSEYFVFGVIIFAMIAFYLSNALYDVCINNLKLLAVWLIPLVIILFSLSCIFLAGFVLKRKFGFRLILIPFIVILITMIISGIIFYLTLNK